MSTICDNIILKKEKKIRGLDDNVLHESSLRLHLTLISYHFKTKIDNRPCTNPFPKIHFVCFFHITSNITYSLDLIPLSSSSLVSHYIKLILFVRLLIISAKSPPLGSFIQDTMMMYLKIIFISSPTVISLINPVTSTTCFVKMIATLSNDLLMQFVEVLDTKT